MSTPTPAERRYQPVTALGAFQAQLVRAGWHTATPTDKYTRAAGISWLEPGMPARTGHTPARLTLSGDAVGLQTFDREGAAMDQVTWGWVDPGNLQRVTAYVQAALADALTARGERGADL